MAPTTTTHAGALRTLLQSWQRSLRTLSMYLPNNPVRQQAVEAIREGLSSVWQHSSSLELTVSETGLQWESETVLSIEDKSESLAWTLFRDGIRRIAFSPGAESEEIVTFLGLVQQARALTDEDKDDLRTLFWSADFEFIRHTVAQLEEGEADPMGESTSVGHTPRPTPEEVRESIREETADLGEDRQDDEAGTQATVNPEEFESTLYSFDAHEMDYLSAEIHREYEQNLNENVLSMLFDIFETRSDSGVREEVISVLGDLLPTLLGSGDFQSVVYFISEGRVALKRADELAKEHDRLMAGLTRILSNPDAVGQLIEALDTATIKPSTEAVEKLCALLTPVVLSTVLMSYGGVTDEKTRAILGRAAARMAESRPIALGEALKSSERVVVREALRLVAERGVRGVGDQLAGLVKSDVVGIRAALVPALAAAPSPETMEALVTLIEDSDSDVRTSAVEALAAKHFEGAVLVLEEAILGKAIRSRELTERRAFFEAYGTIAGGLGVSNLKGILFRTGFWRPVDADTRACAAMALGTVGSPSARSALQRATKDREPVVRSAATRALRQEPE